MGIFFSILSPLIFAVNNFFDKFFLEKYNLQPITMTVINGISGFITGLLIFIVIGSYFLDLKSTVLILSSGFVMMLCLVAYYAALSRDETSRVVPLFQFTPVIVLIMSYFLLGEKLYAKQYFGSILVIASAFAISLEKFDSKIFKLRPAFWLMVLSSLLYSISLVLYKFGVSETSFIRTLPYEGLGMMLGSLAVLSYGNNRKVLFNQIKTFKLKQYLLLSLNDSIYISARYTTYFALSLVSASIVNILLGLQPLFALLCGITLTVWFPKVIKENIKKKVLIQKIIFILLIFFGLYLIFG